MLEYLLFEEDTFILGVYFNKSMQSDAVDSLVLQVSSKFRQVLEYLFEVNTVNKKVRTPLKVICCQSSQLEYLYHDRIICPT